MTYRPLDQADQLVAINRALGNAPTYAETVASMVRSLKGAKRDDAQTRAVKLIARMDDMSFSQYQGRLADTMGVKLTELKRMVKASQKDENKDESGENIEFTIGGMIKGYVVEYLYNRELNKASLAWRDPNGKVDTGGSLVIEGKKYLPKPPDAVTQSGAILYPSKLGEKKDTGTLAAMNLSFIRRNFLFHDSLIPKIMSYWVFLSWSFDCFPAVPYLRATGEPGSGKSEMMLRLALICNKRFVVSGASSTSSLFRIMQVYNFPTLVMDEMDQNRSDAASDIAKLLNQGAMRDGAPITKSSEVTIDGKKDYEPEVYQVYCPKLLSMQGVFFDRALESRCITFQIQPSDPIELRAAKIPIYITEEMKQEALAMRNLLVRWRLENWSLRDMKDEYLNVNISSRLNQVTWPIQALSEGSENEELRREINSFMEDYYRWMTQDKNMTVEARIIEALWTIYKDDELHKQMVEKDSEGREKIKIGFITKIANQIIAWMNMDEDGSDDDGDDDNNKLKIIQIKKNKFDLSPQKVGHRLREKLQVETSERSKDGYSAYWDQIHMEALAKRFGVNVDTLESPVKGNEQAKPVLQTPKQGQLPVENKPD